MISIITPSYNVARFISETIESVQKQTYQEWEMLIVDDCSKDDTVEIVEEYARQDERIKLIQLDANVGAAEARNIALRQAIGPYIAFLDSDDLWYPDKLTKQMDFIRKHDYAFTYTDYECISEDASKILYTVRAPFSIDYSAYLKNTTIGTLTVLINRDKTGLFEMPAIRSSHDMALWLDLMRRGYNAYGLPEVLGQYRQVEGSNTASKWRAAKDVWKVYRDTEKLNVVSSAWNFVHYAVNAALKRTK